MDYTSCQNEKNIVESYQGTIVLQGELTSILDRMGGDAYEKSR